jgi:hypothetical protein
MADPGAGELPEGYRPALTADVPEGRACGNCVFYDASAVSPDGLSAWCTYWNASVRGDHYCDVWSDDAEDSQDIVEEGLEEVGEPVLSVKRSSFETITEDESTMLYQQTSAGGGPMWEGVIAVEEQMTGDGRMFGPGAMRWDNLPVPLRWVKQDKGEHLGAVVVGRVDEVWRDGNLIYGRGVFDAGSADGVEAARQVAEGFTPGVSVDLDDVSFEIRVRADLMDEQILPPEPSPDGMTTVLNVDSEDEIMITTDARLRALTIVATPAFADARIYMTGDQDDTPMMLIDEDQAGMKDEITAGAGPVLPPSSWFIDPKLDRPTPLTITDDGRVYGHLAVWGTCHTGFVGECVEPPASATNYAYFRTGAVRTSDKLTVAVGRLTVDTTHAGRRLGAADTSAHYEHTGMAVADVAAGEDIHGIWVAGSLRSTVTDEQVRALQASPLSGDWRRIGGNLELVAALAVNSPGFPVPRVLVAGGAVQTLQASGVLKEREAEVVTPNVPEGGAEFDMLVRRLIERERRLMDREQKLASAARNRFKVNMARARYQAAVQVMHGDHEQSSHAWGGGVSGAEERSATASETADQMREEIEEARDSGSIDEASYEQLMGDVREAESRIQDAETSLADANDMMADAEESGDDELAQAASELVDDAHGDLAEAEEYLSSAESELEAAINESESVSEAGDLRQAFDNTPTGAQDAAVSVAQQSEEARDSLGGADEPERLEADLDRADQLTAMGENDAGIAADLAEAGDTTAAEASLAASFESLNQAADIVSNVRSELGMSD